MVPLIFRLNLPESTKGINALLLKDMLIGHSDLDNPFWRHSVQMILACIK